MRDHAPIKQGEFTPGNWDTTKDVHFFWSSRYEGDRYEETGMVPIKNYAFYTSLCAHFHDGVPWEDTPWLKWIRERTPSRYKNENRIKRRLRFIEELYNACIEGKYDSTHEVELPLVNIGRHGQIAIEDGRHRICVCKTAGLQSMPVRINAIHPDATWPGKA